MACGCNKNNGPLRTQRLQASQSKPQAQPYVPTAPQPKPISKIQVQVLEPSKGIHNYRIKQ